MTKITNIHTTEAELREQVRTLAEIYGWQMYFTWNSRHSPSGFPDLVLANPAQRRVIFAELKTDNGRVTLQQAEWIATLKLCGQETYLWKPEDIATIARILQPGGETNAR